VSESLPRVTRILEAVGLGPDFGAVAPAVLEAARARGKAVHALLEAHAYGYLEDSDVTADLAPYYSAYLKFLTESGHEPIRSECEVIHPGWGFRGHPDRVGWLNGRRIVLDWKTAESVDLPPAGRQLAGYRLAWNAMHPTEPVDGIAVVQLKADGTYRFHEVSAAEHEPVFLAAVVVYRAQHRRIV